MFKKFIHYLQSLRCKHKWEVHDEYTIAVFTDYQYLFNIMPNTPNVPEYKVRKIILRCSECGDMKEKEFKI